MIRINNTQYFHFLQQADVLRQSGSLCDAIISVQSQTFRAHRLVLACASRALAQHLAKSDADSPAHCTLEYFSPHTFQQVLDFIYTQALEVPVKDLQQLLRAAQVLEMQLLEDQCRKQLDRLEAREKDKNGEAVDLTEEEKSVEEKRQKQKSRPVSESKVQKTSSPVEKPSFGIVMESASIADSADVPANQQSPKRKAKLSPISATLCNRDSVITRPNSSGSSFSSAWAFPTNMWDNGNHLNTLMRIAGNYSNFFASHPLPSSNQTSVVCPFPLSSQHMFPLLSSHFQTPLQSTALGYSRLHPHPYAQNLYTETSRMGSMIKNGILKRKKLSHTSQTVETSYPEVPKVRERADGCQHCSSRLLCDPLLRESASTQLGEKPFECRLCGQRSRDYSAMIKHLRTHGGAAPYQCTVCLEFCSSLVAMQRHIKSHAVQDFPPDWSINNTYLYISHI
uniref:BTB domain-containing protein n=1 Tax=Poecilia mexicana TaxID=48701 RepID=A0A3B3Z3I5_9TELE